MVKMIASIVIIGLTVFAASAYAMMSCSTGGHSAHAEEVAIVNTACPVTGEPADKNITYEYKGKVYGFCCPMCVDEFKNDPEKYIEKMKDQSIAMGGEGVHEGHKH